MNYSGIKADTVKKIIVMGADFNSVNFGCAALGQSLLSILENISISESVFFDIVSANYTQCSMEKKGIYRVKDLQVHYRSLSFYKAFSKEVQDADVVIDFTGGDSYTDIYGFSRFAKETLLKEITLHYKKRLVFGPQTIGPFKNSLIEKWAISVLRRSYRVFVRDNMSFDYLKKKNVDSVQTTDIAFSLRKDNSDGFSHYFVNNGKKRVGLNVSALMKNNGYSGKNKLGIIVDYDELIKDIITSLLDKAYEVYLIAHVLDTKHSEEDDYSFCKELHAKYPATVMSPRFISPMEAKAYMGNLDCLIGSRMHATIGAFSVGVPIIALSYSRKFQGLYYSLGYNYVIDTKKTSKKKALNTIIEWIENNDYLRQNMDQSNKIVVERIEQLKVELSNVLCS